MTLIDEIHTAGQRTGAGCSMATVLSTLIPGDQIDLAVALNDSAHFRGPAIGKALRARGFQVSDQTVRRHRNGACSCPR